MNRYFFLSSFFLASLSFYSVGFSGNTSLSVKAPKKDIKAVVTLDRNGSISIDCIFNGQLFLSSKNIGVDLGSDYKFTSDLKYMGYKIKSFYERFHLTTGKRTSCKHSSNEKSFFFKNKNGNELILKVRVSDEGIAWRYVIKGKGKALFNNEFTNFIIPRKSKFWIRPWKRNYEKLFTSKKFGKELKKGRYCLPVLYEFGTGVWALITEADLDGTNAAMSLYINDPDKNIFDSYIPGIPFECSLPYKTPWRVAVIGDLKTIVETTLVEELSAPSVEKDTSWIKPGRVAWSWWSESKSPHSFTRQKDFVDFASFMGWEYNLVDEGWKKHDWIRDLIKYADSKNVGIILWVKWHDLDTNEKRQKLLPKWKAWGVKGIKVDFMDSDTKERMEFYENMTQAALKNKLLLNFHGATLPRGQRRTYPNLMTMEGVLGAEYYKWSKTPTPEHNTVLPYTRNTVGPMDYTPVTFSAKTRATSDAHELSLAIVFESGLQHFADSPESYKNPKYSNGLELLKKVPTVWDETRFLCGYPGKLFAVARRKGKNWFVGIIHAGKPCKVPINLSFLGKGSWNLTSFYDGENKIETNKKTVYSKETIQIKLKENGGWSGLFEK